MPAHRDHGDDLRGASRLVLDATTGVTEVVEQMHHTIASGPDLLGRPLAAPAGLVTGLVYGSIKGVTALVGRGLDEVLTRLGPMLGSSQPGLEREAVLAVVNGVVGDHLEASGNPLAIPMRFRQRGVPLTLTPEALRAAFPEAGGKVVVMIHGSSMCDLQWQRRGHDHGAALARDLGYTPLYLHYNSGRHISTNGAELATLLETVVAAWPTAIESLVLLGHSMGGLVARSAVLAAEARGATWRGKLSALVCVGSPHHGAPLERGGNMIDRLLGVSRYSAPLGRLGRLRSAGVTDLRHGNVLDAHWDGADRFAHHDDRRCAAPLPAGVDCFAIAGTTSRTPVGGDGLVPIDSALGRHSHGERELAFPEAHRAICPGTGHIELIASPAVYAKIYGWLGGEAANASASAR